MAFNLQALRVFAAVAERGGFSRAAAVLHLSQPAVSRAVLGLERDIGSPLLERGAARGVRLTGAGAALYARARELFAVERTAEEEVRAQLGLAMISRAAATSLTQLGRLMVLPIGDDAGRALDVRRPLSELRLPERVPSARRRWCSGRCCGG